MFSVDVTQEHHVYLLEDGLELYHTTLQHAPHLTVQMSALLPPVLALLDRGDECVKLGLMAAESAVMLGGDAVLGAHGAALATMLEPLVGNVPPSGAAVLCRLVNLVLIGFPAAGTNLLERVLHAVLMTVLEYGHAVSSEVGGVYAHYATVFARLLLVNPDAFCELCGAIAARAGADAIGPLLDLWLDKFDAVSEQRSRKLSVLALAACLGGYPALDPYLLPRFPLVVDKLAAGLHQFLFMGDDELDVDFLVQDFADDDDEGGGGGSGGGSGPPPAAIATEPGRRREISKSDPVFTVNIRDAAADSVGRLAARVRAVRDTASHSP
jgi:hypothetical protein